MTREQVVTPTPTALAGLVTGESYFLQNSGGYNSTRWLRVAIKPDVASVSLDGGFVLEFGQCSPISTATGEICFIWNNSPDRDNFLATYDEVAG